MTKNLKLSDGARKLFLDLWADADNWSGQPLFGGNVGFTEADKGFLTKLKKEGLVTTFIEPGGHGEQSELAFVDFTDAGKTLADELSNERSQ